MNVNLTDAGSSTLKFGWANFFFFIVCRLSYLIFLTLFEVCVEILEFIKN